MPPPPLRIASINGLHPGLDTLRATAAAEGFRFLDRLVDDWHSGANRFDRPGELLVGAFRSGVLLGVSGLNRDPFTEEEGSGRLRHLYVKPSARRCGVGSALVGHLLSRAEEMFRIVRLRTESPAAAALYARHGFVPVTSDKASHVRVLRPA